MRQRPRLPVSGASSYKHYRGSLFDDYFAITPPCRRKDQANGVTPQDRSKHLYERFPHAAHVHGVAIPKGCSSDTQTQEWEVSIVQVFRLTQLVLQNCRTALHGNNGATAALRSR